MRIGESSVYRQSLLDLLSLTQRQVEINQQVSTNSKVNYPSDDPGGASSVLNSHRSLMVIEQYGSNLESAGTWMTASESAMQSLVERLERAMVLAEQAANGTYNKLEQQGVASEVAAIIDQVITLANTQVDGVYIFGGSLTNLPPIDSLLVASQQSLLTTVGHSTVASLEGAAGTWRLRLSSSLSGPDGQIHLAADNTLGEGLGLGGGAGFDTWTHTQVAGSNPPQGDIFSSTINLANTDDTTPVSDRVGETLSWLGPSGVMQTYQTRAQVSFSGGAAPGDDATVTIGTDAYTVSGVDADAMAANLVEQVNQAGAGYFAYVSGAGTVEILSLSGASYTVVETGADTGNDMSVDAATSLTDLSNQINGGLQATGMVHILDAALPAVDDTVTFGDRTATWAQILPGYDPLVNTADELAQALENWINADGDVFSASRVTGAAGSSVIIQASEVGTAHNVTLAAQGGVLTSGSLRGGLGGAATASDGALYASGSSTLRQGLSINAQVMENSGGTVTLRLTWHDADGSRQSQDISLPAAGETAAVSVPGLGGLQIYRDDRTFTVGDIFQLTVGHYQGNLEELEVNFSDNSRMTFNWNAYQLLGGNQGLDLDHLAVEGHAGNAGSGQVGLSGRYYGLGSRDLSLQVVDGGQVPGDDVTLQVTWRNQNQELHSEQVTISQAGLAGAVALPGGEGISIHLDGGTFQAGDTYLAEIENDALHVLDTLNEWHYQLINGDEVEAQHESQRTLEALHLAVGSILDQVAAAGARQKRIEVREAVMEQQTLAVSQTLEDLEAVDLTEALAKLNSQQIAYNAALKTVASMSELFLLSYL